MSIFYRVAYDKSGRAVGAAVNNSCHEAEFDESLEEELDGLEDQRYRPIQALHRQLREQNRHRVMALVSMDVIPMSRSL